jgi:hypothetical protein
MKDCGRRDPILSGGALYETDETLRRTGNREIFETADFEGVVGGSVL